MGLENEAAQGFEPRISSHQDSLIGQRSMSACLHTFPSLEFFVQGF